MSLVKVSLPPIWFVPLTVLSIVEGQNMGLNILPCALPYSKPSDPVALKCNSLCGKHTRHSGCTLVPCDVSSHSDSSLVFKTINSTFSILEKIVAVLGFIVALQTFFIFVVPVPTPTLKSLVFCSLHLVSSS